MVAQIGNGFWTQIGVFQIEFSQFITTGHNYLYRFQIQAFKGRLISEGNLITVYS